MIAKDIHYIGVNDHRIDLFESQYTVPNGVSYNSYVITDEKIAVMDTVDAAFTHEWLVNLETVLKGRRPDYLVIQHMEPDHSASIAVFKKNYPDTAIVATSKAFAMMRQFFGKDFTENRTVVSDGDTLPLGAHILHFVAAPMVHWPEVIVSYEETEKILFSADGFGKFGALSAEEEWTDEARRYFINIVGKYGVQVQTLLKKAAALDIQTICPLHGPILKDNLGFYIGKYLTWSSYEPEEDGVLVACASIHGNTKAAAEKMVEVLRANGASKVVFMDLTRDDMAEAVADAFRYGKIILAAASYDAWVFPPMEDFLHRLAHKNLQKRTFGLIENGSWAPCAAKGMKGILKGMKEVNICENVVSIKSTMKDTDVAKMEELAKEILA